MSGQDSQAPNAPSPLSVIPLVARTVKLFGRPTQLRLEPSYWEALDDICHREDLTVDELCSDLKDRLDSQSRRSRGIAVSLANAVRVFIVGYYRKAATEKATTAPAMAAATPSSAPPSIWPRRNPPRKADPRLIHPAGIRCRARIAWKRGGFRPPPARTARIRLKSITSGLHRDGISCVDRVGGVA